VPENAATLTRQEFLEVARRSLAPEFGGEFDANGLTWATNPA
jgi:hypothetical protein